jgi:hypothetical protein
MEKPNFMRIEMAPGAVPDAVALGEDLIGKITGVDIVDQNGVHPIWRSGDPTVAPSNTVAPVSVQVGSSWEIRVYYTFTAVESGSSSWAATAIVSGNPLNDNGVSYSPSELIGVNSYFTGESGRMDATDIAPQSGGFKMPENTVTINRIKLFGSPNHVWTAKPDYSLW